MDIKTLGNETAQAQGVWFTYENADGSSFELQIAAANNKNFRDKQTKLLLAGQRANKGKPISLIQYPDIALRASVGTVLTNWRGLESNGAEYAFNEDNAVSLLTRRTLEIESIRQFIDARSVEAENFQGESETAQKADIKSGDSVGVVVG